MDNPPVAKYKLTIEFTGNSHEELETEILYYQNGGYLLDSDYHKRDQFDVLGGRKTTRLEHTNPEMTPERYDEELQAWSANRREH